MKTELIKKYNLELETIKVKEVRFDVYFTYNKEFGFDIHSIEDVSGTQDLTEHLADWVLEAIEDKIQDMYERRGWL